MHMQCVSSDCAIILSGVCWSSELCVLASLANWLWDWPIPYARWKRLSAGH